MRSELPLHARYTLHGVSHMLGLDVHDCAHARETSYYKGTLEEGFVLTVEPGLYFQPDDLTVPEQYRGSAFASKMTSSSRRTGAACSPGRCRGTPTRSRRGWPSSRSGPAPSLGV